ncbi:GNAT family N-acetyltransferase [Albimonas sp. CAU 1670]|uniref:GNAT family N-acetyltransferase n=1 Tax=Albimonas sp. CAU 1670 TaxID=3032599 RepID=UPI0023DAED85|nr:GNAT family N-acetyltransferase [Albimonas sp. CAU 1670]MDF2231878.1 GNAT family N-acetyltransferase [Albimonas sp. CAU 1670]
MSGLGEVPPVLRPGRVEDAVACARIEAACALQFADSPQPWVAARTPPPPAEHAQAAALRRLEVAELFDQVVGFAILEPDAASGTLHLAELDVAPRFQRRGLARALIERAMLRTAERGLAALTLTTFRNVAWNAPLYERLGFAALPPEAWTEPCRRDSAGLAARGLPTVDRVAMIRRL